MKQPKDKLCLHCKYFIFDGGEHDYSEETPGSNSSMSCNENRWKLIAQPDMYDFRRIFPTAETCSVYELHDYFKEPTDGK